VTIRHFLQIVELRTKIISVSTYTLATVFVLATGSAVDPVLAALLFAAILCVDMGTTAFNSFFDFVRGVDNRLFTVETDKVLVHEGVAPGHALLVSVGLYAAAAVLGVFIALQIGWWVVGVGVLGMAVGFLYTGGPIPISRTPFGELFSGGFLGTVLFLVIVAAHGVPIRAGLLASLPSTLLIASVLTVNNTCDIEGDVASGRRTLSIVMGARAGAFLVYGLGLLAFLFPALAALGVDGVGRFAPPPISTIGLLPLAAALVLAVFIYRSMERRGYSHATKPVNMRSIIRVVLIFTVGYALALAL
jgi:1,4-dihydroxy-2-naphthoate octaprenyltransferase